MTRETLDHLARLHTEATVNWRTTPNSSGGCTLLRGEHEGPLMARHPQSHLQIVPAEDAELIAAMRNSLPDLLALASLGLHVLEMPFEQRSGLERVADAALLDSSESEDYEMLLHAKEHARWLLALLPHEETERT